MDLHIERPELNAPTAEENIAAVDTWIADTADKLNIALTSLNTKIKNAGSGSSGGGSSGGGSGGQTIPENKIPYLGDYQVETTDLIIGG